MMIDFILDQCNGCREGNNVSRNVPSEGSSFVQITCENKSYMSTTHAPAITAAVIEEHGITPEEYEKIKAALGREPSLTELGIFSVMWSEHCSYKSVSLHLKPLASPSKQGVQGPGGNAGHIDHGHGWGCAF